MKNKKKIIINTDGAARGNPGPAAAAFVIRTDDDVIEAQGGKCLGIATNNKAEYTAVKLALETLIKDLSRFLPATVIVRTDSLLMANQLSGNFKVKNPDLQILYKQIKELEQKVGQVTYFYTPRAENFLADKLANNALDNQL